ncbi:MAG: FtsX-like permease family protein [Myxococcota bacterium]
MGSFDRLKLIAAIAIRSLSAHRGKNLVIGGILFVGTYLVVFGSAMLSNIERSMTQSITGSISGHLQVFDKNAHDQLSLFGGGPLAGQEDFGHLADFSALKPVILSEPNVESAVPMGLDNAFINGGNDVDRILESFRQAVERHDETAMTRQRGQIEEIARLLISELDHTAELTGAPEAERQKRADLSRVLSPEFWESFAKNPETELQFLDTKMAPLLENGRTISIMYIGADLDAFQEHYDRFEITEGQMVPRGHRGFLFNDRFAEEVLKHKVARDFDALKKELGERGGKIAGDAILEGRIRKLTRLYRSIALQLDTQEIADLSPLLEKECPGEPGRPIARLLESFLALDDENFKRRYDLFYKEIAPRIELFDIKVGDTITVRTNTKSGQLSSVNVKVYGKFRFRGLDRSDLAGGHNLMDLMSFRDLYDFNNERRNAETEALRRHITEIKDSANADEAFFGDGGAAEAETVDTSKFDEFTGVALRHETDRRAKLEDEFYDQAAIEKGVVLNVAVRLKDPSKIEETRAALEKKLEPLGAQVIDWKQAAGMIGQFLTLVEVILLVAAGIIFFVGMVIINNSMLLATMERVAEIGTLLAIGASEGFVLLMMVLETSVLGLVSGGLGGLMAIGTVKLLERTGIPAPNDWLAFLFSGPRLFPTIQPSDFLVGLVVVLVVSVASSLFPAIVATRISPRAAMEAKE